MADSRPADDDYGQDEHYQFHIGDNRRTVNKHTTSNRTLCYRK